MIKFKTAVLEPETQYMVTKLCKIQYFILSFHWMKSWCTDMRQFIRREPIICNPNDYQYKFPPPCDKSDSKKWLSGS